MRDYITSIDIRTQYGDRVFLKRVKNPHTGIQESWQRESWIKMLKGHIKDIEREINFVEGVGTK